MHSENLHTEYTVNFDGHRNRKLFSEGGIAPSGECWVSPTDTFLRIWNSPAGVYFKEQGFRLEHDGKQVGASQDCVLYCPRENRGESELGGVANDAQRTE